MHSLFEQPRRDVSATSCLSNLLFSFGTIFPFRLDQMEVQVAAAGINVGIAGVFLFGTLIVGLNAADLRSLVFGKAQNCILGCRSLWNGQQVIPFRPIFKPKYSDAILGVTVDLTASKIVIDISPFNFSDKFSLSSEYTEKKS